ncbi:MAG TPA: hypothetical protein VF547_03800 [Allosphingosinicella sp.]|jgi:hypothetical protein
MIGPAALAAAALAAQGVALPGAGAEWRLATADGDSAIFVDHAGLERAGNKVRFWSLKVVRRQGPEFSGARALTQADCRKFTYRPLTTVFILGATPVISGAGRTALARPGRSEYEMLRVACGLRAPGAASADPVADMFARWRLEKR